MFIVREIKQKLLCNFSEVFFDSPLNIGISHSDPAVICLDFKNIIENYIFNDMKPLNNAGPSETPKTLWTHFDFFWPSLS